MRVLDRETRKRIEDYFEGFELVEYLQLPISAVIEMIEDYDESIIEGVLEDVEELIGVRNERDEYGDTGD